jgi:hypothetical protein
MQKRAVNGPPATCAVLRTYLTGYVRRTAHSRDGALHGLERAPPQNLAALFDELEGAFEREEAGAEGFVVTVAGSSGRKSVALGSITDHAVGFVSGERASVRRAWCR